MKSKTDWEGAPLDFPQSIRKILPIIFRFCFRKIRFQRGFKPDVNRWLHPKMKPLVAGGRFHAN